MITRPATASDDLEDPDGAAAVEADVSRAEELARRLDKPMAALGVLFLFVVLGQTVADDARTLTVLSIVGWVLWVAFVAEFALRAVVARNRRHFWRRNWWQIVFLALPFLRFVRVLMFLRVARVGGVLSAAVRGSRSGGRLLSGRLAWLAMVTTVVVLASSQLLHVLGYYSSYGDALHDAAMSTVTGQPLAADGGLVRIAEVALAIYSVAVFATLAGALGAYFLEARDGPADSAAPARAATPAGSATPADRTE